MSCASPAASALAAAAAAPIIERKAFRVEEASTCASMAAPMDSLVHTLEKRWPGRPGLGEYNGKSQKTGERPIPANFFLDLSGFWILGGIPAILNLYRKSSDVYILVQNRRPAGRR